MKLELNIDETKAVLLAYAERNFPGAFNNVEIDIAKYSSRGTVVFIKLSPEAPEELEAA